MPLAKDNYTQYFGIHTFNWHGKQVTLYKVTHFPVCSFKDSGKT